MYLHIISDSYCISVSFEILVFYWGEPKQLYVSKVNCMSVGFTVKKAKHI